MSTNPENSNRLDSWKEIAAYVGRDVRTVIRWEKKGGLPVYRIPVGQRQSVYAFKHEIDAWMMGGTPGSFELAAALETAAALPGWGPQGGSSRDLSAPAAAASGEQGSSTRGLSNKITIWCVVATMVAVAAYGLIRAESPRRIVITGVSQLTSNGVGKTGLVTNGRELFFSEQLNGGLVLATVPIGGGGIRTIPLPFAQAAVQAVSTDGQDLLVLSSEGQEAEQGLWIVPAAGGEPHRVGSVRCHTATWSPDARWIAFAHDNSIYVTDRQGTLPKELHSFTAIPDLLEWSPDGRRLRFDLREMGAENMSLWEMSLRTDPAMVTSLKPLDIQFDECCASSSAIDRNGMSFVTGAGFTGNPTYAIELRSGLTGSRFVATPIKHVITEPGWIAADFQSKQIFMLGVSASANASPENHWSEDYIYDRKSGEIRPYLPGTPAHYIDFSRDGKWIAWVGADDRSLWVSRPDGTEARQIDFPRASIQLPRWSPDQRQIAFMARVPGRGYRIFLTPIDGGRPREASLGSDSQGAPTWSPDGRWLSYGNVFCQESGTCAIHKIDLRTGQESTIPGSEGLATARWSPDGRSIAALRPQMHQIYLFDLRSERWRKLADDVSGNDLAWSSGSQYLYASNPMGDRPNVIRIRVSDGTAEGAVNLSAFRSMAGYIDSWFTLTPDDNIVFVRWHQPNEVYSLSYVEK